MTKNIGSKWEKWDLHIHSPESINQNYPSTQVGWDKFINTFESHP